MAIVTCVVTKLAGVTEPVSADTSILANAEFSASANAKIYHVFNFKRLTTGKNNSRNTNNEDLNRTNSLVSTTTTSAVQAAARTSHRNQQRSDAGCTLATQAFIETYDTVR